MLVAFLNMTTFANVAHAQIPGKIENAPDLFMIGSSSTVYAAAVQPDGKIIVGGLFTIAVSQHATNNLVRLNADGSVDPTFNVGTSQFLNVPGPNDAVYSIAVQADGKILIGGHFTTFNGQACGRLARLTADGTLESTSTFNPGTGPNNDVNCLTVQPDGQILVGGNFSTFNGSSIAGLVRLNPDGSMESNSTFNIGTGAIGGVNTVAVQTDGKILIGGAFTTVNSQTRTRYARLNANGSVESNSTFIAPLGVGLSVTSIAVQGDGKILLAGPFTSLGSGGGRYISRLATNGALESTSTFSPGTGPNNTVNNMIAQVNGKLLVGGLFTSINSQTRNRIARLNSDGSAESTTTFDTGSGASASTYVGLQGDGKILALGAFQNFSGLFRWSLARLANDAATSSFSFTDSQVQWLRGGAAPETQQVSFDVLKPGDTDWTSLGSGARISGGWQLNSASFNGGGYVRARARVAGGYGNGSSGLVEEIKNFGGQPAVLAVTLPVTNFGSPANPPVSFTDVPPTLSGSVCAFNSSTTASFEYGFDSNYGNTLSATPGTITGSNGVPVSAQPPNLPQGTVIHYRVKATNAAGTSYGNDITFRTASTDDNLTTLSVDGATLTPTFYNSLYGGGIPYNAVLPASSTSALVNIVRSDPFATVTVNGTPLAQDASSITVPLSPGNTLVSITVIATDGVTSQTIPLYVTRTTSPTVSPTHCDVSDTSASLNVLVTPYATACALSFEYGLDTSYGATVMGPTVSGGFQIKSGVTVSGLLAGHVYHYRATATNSEGTVTSTDGTFTTTATPAPGRVDSGFVSGASGTIQAAVLLPDGKYLLAGYFTDIGGTAAYGLARLNADGSRDTNFSPSVDSEILCVATQPDGAILIGGYFTKVNGVARKNMARLLPDGTLDASFAPEPGSDVASIAVQPDGKILVGGDFTSIAGVTQKYLARLNSNGSLDNNFLPVVDLWLTCVTLQADGHILIGGWFSTVNGATHNDVARLNANGTVDSTFNAGTDSFVRSVLAQPDGSVLMTGFFSKVNGVPRGNFARVDATGALDSAFAPALIIGSGTGSVYSMALQVDGKILIGGNFSQVNSVDRNYIARLNADGSLDGGFDPDASGTVSSVAVQPDGGVLLGGSFQTVFGSPAYHMARLLNDAATHTLSAPDDTHAHWQLAGTAPVVDVVTFEASTNGGATWSTVGPGVPVSDGWQLSSGVLPVQGLLRVRAMSQTGEYNGSGNMMTDKVSYTLSPHLTLEQPAGSALNAGGTVDFGTAGVGQPVTRTFAIKSTGTARLDNLVITPGASDSSYAVSTSPTGPVPVGGSTTFVITFLPQATGAHPSTLHVASNDATTPAFDINLTGTALPPQEAWRLQNFGITTNTGNAADLATPDHDGVCNLIKYALLLPTGQSAASLLPQAQNVKATGGTQCLVLQFTYAPYHSDITISVEAADSLIGPWTTLCSSVQGAPFIGFSPTNATILGGGLLRVTVPDIVNMSDAPRRFMRIEVTR